jgi:hypothetical protein
MERNNREDEFAVLMGWLPPEGQYRLPQLPERITAALPPRAIGRAARLQRVSHRFDPIFDPILASICGVVSLENAFAAALR